MRTRVFLIALCLLAPLAIHADDAPQNYDVELLIFRLIRPSATQENWAIESVVEHAPTVSAADGEETIATTPAPSPDTTTPSEPSFAPLATTQYKLNSVEETIRKSRSYLPVAHFGWTQPGMPIDHAPSYPLQNFLPGFLPDNISITGQASLARGHYLHLLLDITYQAPDGQRYVIREQRRMRSNEKHYFDHPYFGVIVQITPRTT